MIATSPGQIAFLLVAGLLSGAINAVAGGGSLLVFPALLAVGLSPLAANVTNSIAQWPGYLGLVLGGRRELRGQRRRLLSTLPVAVVGAGGGAALLLVLPSEVFNSVVPGLVLLAALMLAFGPRIKRWTGEPDPDAPDRKTVLLPVILVAAVYGGYFGGALGVILIAALGLCAHDRLVRLNATKGALSLAIATVTVVVFGIGAPVDWLGVALIAPTTLVGGFLGAKLARVLPELVLRTAVVLLAFAVAVYLFVAGAG